MKENLSQLSGLLKILPSRLTAIPEAEASMKPAPGKWSKKEILGHLIDSAFNNHRRFVIGQSQKRFARIGYEQDEWVLAQQYQQMNWADIIQLWTVLNHHLAHTWKHLPPAAWEHTTVSDEGGTRNLAWLATDYIAHMKHHLKAISSDLI